MKEQYADSLRDKKYGHIKRGHYQVGDESYYFRSRWEADYAKYLEWLYKNKNIGLWEYETDVFIFEKIRFGTRSYRPDFKITNTDGTVEYHEVKGYMNPRSKTQIKRMRIYYPDVKLIIIDGKQYREIMKYERLFNNKR